MIIKELIKTLNKSKICAVVTAACFMISTLGANLYATPMTENITQKYEDVFSKTNVISNEYGKITASKDAKSNTTVINIQDLHCHPETQRNISKIIKEISDKYNLKKIYVEGGYGNIDTSWLKQITDENIRKQVIEKLVDEGILTGSEYYKITSDTQNVELKGIDEENIHKDNVRRLSWIISQQDKYKQVIDKVNNEIKILEKIYVNKRNKRFNDTINDYLSNKIDSKKFYKQLTKYVKDINNNPDKYNNITAVRIEDYPNINKFITLRNISKKTNIKEVTQQLQIVINELKNRLPYGVYTKLLKETENLSNGQKVIELIPLLCKKEEINLEKYKALKFFLESNYITKNINPIDLVQEERQLISEIRKALSYNNEEYEITFVSDFSRYFTDYLEYKLTDTNWKYFEKEYKNFRQIYNKYATVDRIKEIEQDFEEINKYYRINDQRNNVFVTKLLENEKINLIDCERNRNSDEILKSSKDVIIAVTGGFHSSELEQLLTSNDVNTIVITPKIYEDIKQANDKYIELIGIQGKVNSQALAYTIASCTTDINKKRLLLMIAKELVGENTEQLEKILGRKVDFSLLQEDINTDIQTKSKLKNIIETSVEQILNEIPQNGLTGTFIPDIDEIMLNMAQQLVKQGIYFSDGIIFDIEKSELKEKDLNGIPAEIYSRMLPSLQKALLKISEKKEEIIKDKDEDIYSEDIKDILEDTGATETVNIYLEDINSDPENFLNLLRDAITNKKLIILHVFRNPVDIDGLDRETQNRLYREIREMFFKIYTDKPLYSDNFISQPENKEFIQYDIHFFLLEILENSFMHGNKGLDNPIYVYMDLNEQKEINSLKIYNRTSQEDDNFQMRFIRMKLALLGGQHKSNVLMRQNPYRTFEIDDNFKDKFYKVTSDIKPVYDDKAAQNLRDTSSSINYFSIFNPLQNRNPLFGTLSKIPHIWEEILFRFIPASLSIFAMSVPALSCFALPIGLIFFVVCQNQFIKAHNISVWIKENNLDWSTGKILKATILNVFPSKQSKKEFKQFNEKNAVVRKQTRQRILPTMLLSVPYIYSMLFAPSIPVVLLATVIGIVIHKYFNSILYAKLNIFKQEEKKEIPTLSQFLSDKKTIDLSNEQEKQLLIDILNNQNLSSQEAKELVDKINLEDLQQSKYLLEVFEKQIKITDYNKKQIIDVIANKFDADSDVQLAFIRNLLLDDKFFVYDENIAIILVDKLDFNNAKQFNLLKDFLSNKVYNRNLQKHNLDIKLLNKIDVNDIEQMSLLDLFYNISDQTLYNLISKFDFSNKKNLQSFFRIISKYNLVQKVESFELILNKLDLKNQIDFRLLQNIVFNIDYIDGNAVDKLFDKLNFTDKTHLNLIRHVINKRNTELTTIESLIKYVNINNQTHVSLITDLIKNFFIANTKDSKLMFYEKIRKKVETLNFEQMNDKDSYVYKIFTDELIVSMQKEMVKIQNDNIRAKNDKMIIYMLSPQIFNELIKITNILSNNNNFLSEKSQNNLQILQEQISFFEDMRAEKVTIKDFAEKYGFNFSQQTPNTYIDSNRYSFTKLLGLFSEKILRHKVINHSPAYLIEKNEIDKKNLKSLLRKFDAYMKLLDENVYVLNKFSEVTAFDSQFDDVIKHINLMLDYLYVIDAGEADAMRRSLNDILENIRNGKTTIEEQKMFLLSNNVHEISTINRLVNQIHQKANLDFVLDIRRSYGLSLSKVQNVFVSKDDRTIAAYNLSQKPMNPEIKRLLLMLIENPDFSTYDNSQIFIKDNIFLWNGLLGDHSARVLIDFSKESKNIFVDFSEAERTNESRARIAALRKIFTNFGFYADLYNNNNSLVATVNKEHGLSDDTDICELAQKAMVALNNAGSLYRANIPKQVIETATLGVMDIYRKCFFVSSFDKNIIDTKVNNIKFLNRILAHLQLPLIPSSEEGMISYIKRGLFFATKTKTLGQNTIDKYINKPIEQAFATGYLKINDSGYLERNNEYNPILEISNKLNSIINEEIGKEQELEMLNNGAVLSQMSQEDLNLKTQGQIGGYILKTGYIRLINGTTDNNTKGEFLSVRILIDKNGIIRYSETELVGLPESMKNKTGRQPLTSSQLQQILSNEGYDITKPEPLTDSELITYRVRLQEPVLNSQTPTAYGTLISVPNEVTSVVGIMGADKNDGIFVGEFASPDNVSTAAQNKISLFTGGSYASHAGIVLREYHKTAMVVNDAQITNEGIKIKFYQPKESISKVGEIYTQEIEETEITLQDKDIVLIDTINNKLILYPYNVFKNILFDLQEYINTQNAEKIKELIEKYKNSKLIDKIIEYIHYQSGDNVWLLDVLADYSSTVYDREQNIYETPSRFINKIKITIDKYLPHNSRNNVYRFGEKESLDAAKVGTKSANQSKLFLIIEQLKKQTGISNVAVPNGMAVDYTILENLLGSEYITLYNKLESIIQSNKDEKAKFEEAQEILSQITDLINNISNSRIKDYIGKNNLKIFKNNPVIVRSSGVDEDGEDFSAAGIAESFGNVSYENISKAVKDVLSSFFSQRAFDYMLKSGKLIKPAVLIEDWIDADKAGIMMSENSDGNRLIQVINGQGEDIVSGRITPYSFIIDINTGEKIDGNYTNEKTITKDTLEQLTQIMQWLEEVEGVPVDIEFLIKNNTIYIVQVRPITTLGYETENNIEEEEIEEPEYDEYITEYEDTSEKETEDVLPEEESFVEKTDTGYPVKSKNKSKNKKQKKSKKKSKSKSSKSKSSKTKSDSTFSDSDSVIRQPKNFTLDDIINSFTKLANSKDSFDSSLELNQQQIKTVLLRAGLTKEQVDKINFDEGLPDYVISLLKSKNTQITGTTINPRKTLIENLKEHPILFSLALETFMRVYENNLGPNATFKDLLNFINQRYAKRLYEATCTDLRGYFGEFYVANTLVAGIIPDKRAGPIIIRPEMPTDNNIRGFDVYDINGVKIQVKTGGSEIVHHHFSRYWFASSKNSDQGIIAIPVLTTKNVKNNSFNRDNRVQGFDITTETVTKFSHEMVSALYGIGYKKNIPGIGNIRLKDLIDSFKGFPTENSITLDELINILDKNQHGTVKKAKKSYKKQEENVIEFNSRRINVDNIINQDIIVTINPEQTHILSVNDEQILLNEERKREISKEEYSLYGIENVEYDEFGNITYITFKEDVSLSNITIDGKPEGSKENNIAFSEQEIEGLNKDTQTQGYIDVYLDGDIDEICHLIKKAATEKKLVVFHLFEKGFNTSKLTPSQLLDVYKNAVSLISNRFQLSDIFSHPIDDSQYTDYGIDFFFEEILKNAFIRGNFGQFEEPIALHIKLDENKNMLGFSVYNKSVEGEIYKHKEALARASHFMFTGDSRSTDIMLNNPVREYKLDKKQINGTDFKKADVSFRDTIDMEKYQLEQDYKKSEENVSITDIALQSETTKKALQRKGTKKYKEQYLEQTGKQEKDLTFEERLAIAEQAEKYRFTFSGIIDGVLIEVFSIFSRNFIPSHSKMPFISKVIVHTIRILSVSVGISFAIFSFSALPIGTAIVSTIIISPLSTIVSSTIMHLLWNVIAVITNNQDWFLQRDYNSTDSLEAPLSLVLKDLIANKSRTSKKGIFAIEQLEGVLKPINLRKEIIYSEISQYFASQAQKNGAKLISVYDLISELRTLKRRNFINNAGIEQYRSSRTYINPIHRQYFESKNRFVENSFGFALGISYTNISSYEKKVNLVQAISEKNNIVSWERGYEYFYGPEYPATPPEDYMEKIKKMSLEYNKKIFFFLPRNIDSDDLSFKTRKELEYIQQHPEMLKNVIFVFGTYDCFNIESREIFDKYFGEEKIASTIKRLLCHPEIYVSETLDIIEKIRSTGLFKFFNNISKLSFKKVVDLIAVLKNLEYSKKDIVMENKEGVEQLRNDIINDNNKKVCFICTANLNRSAVSHLLFEDKLLKAGIENISVVSAGLMPVSQKISTQDLSLGQDYRKILDGFDVNQDLIENFRSEEFSDKHIDSDYFIVASQKHKTLLIKKYNIDPAKIILYSDLDSELKTDVLPDPQKLKISKSDMVNLVSNIFNNTLFNFVLKESSGWLKRLLLNQNNSKAKTVIVNYKHIKAKELEQLLNSQQENKQEITDVYIVDDIEQLQDKYILTNTGIKIDGQFIFQIKTGNMLMYGANGVPRIKIAKAINETEQIKKSLKSILSIQENIEIEGIIRRNGDGIGINDGLLEIGEMELFGKSEKEVEEYMLSALEVKNTIGLMYGQKTIIDLKSLSGQELLTALENGRTRKVITEEQFDQLQLNKEKILELRENGIEIYIDTENKDYKEYGISGQIIKEGKKKYIYDYYSGDKIDLDVINHEKDLSNLEYKIINSNIPILIDIEILKNSFQKKNSIEAVEMLSALLGKIKISMGLGNINKKDIENIGYNISFDKVPAMSMQEVTDLLGMKYKEDILNIIGYDNEFGIILSSIKDKKVAERFIEIIKERIFAKTKLIEQGKEFGLKDKKLEKLLGQMLIKQINNEDKTTKNFMYKQKGREIRGNKEDIIGKIIEDTEKVMSDRTIKADREIAINTIIEIILVYGDDYKNKQVTTDHLENITSNYRAMLAAA